MGIDPVSLAITIALNAAVMGLNAMRKIEGPRVTDLSVSTADYGTPLNYLRGSRRVELPVFYAEPIRETKTRRKTKAGKYSEYEYHGTLAYLVADHEIALYERIWLDRRLAYDATGSGTPEESLDFLDYARFYYGTSTQDPDERMLATIEAEEGPGTCPAYLDVAYIFLEELPLQPFGNRFPQASAQVSTVGSGEGEFGAEAYSNTVDENDPFSPYFGYQPGFMDDSNRYGWITVSFDYGYCFDFQARTVLQVADLATDNSYTTEGETLSGFQTFAVDSEGSAWGQPDSETREFLEWAIGATQPELRGRWTNTDGDPFGSRAGKMFAFDTADGIKITVTTDGVLNSYTYIFDKTSSAVEAETDLQTLSGLDINPRHYFRDATGDIWVSASHRTSTSQETAYLFRLTDYTGSSPYPSSLTITGLPTITSTSASLICFLNGSDIIAAWQTSRDPSEIKEVRRISLSDGSTLASNTSIPTAEWLFNYARPPGIEHFYLQESASRTSYRYDVNTLQKTASYDLDTWAVSGDDVAEHRHNALIDAFFGSETDFGSPDTTGTLRIYLLGGGDPVTLGSICADLADGAGMSSTDYDFSDLDQSIPGFSWSQGSGKDIIAPLLELYDSDIRPNGFVLEGLKRGSAITTTSIPYDDFVREDEDEASYEISLTSESDLPRRIFATFADTNAEQQPNTATYQRSAVSVLTKRETSIDLTTLAIAPSDIQPLVERALRRIWIGATRARHALPPNYLSILPGDVHPIQFDDDNLLRLRLVRMEIAPNRILRCTWEQDRAAVEDASEDVGAVSLLRTSPGAAASGRPTPSVFAPVDSVLFVLDIPLLSDADDRTTPFLYIGAAPVSSGDWAGAEVQRSDSGDADTYEGGFAGFSNAGATVWGTMYNPLPDALTSVIDDGSDLIVGLAAGETLTSATEDQLLADQTLNLALVGAPGRWEIIQFRDATLQSEGEWILNGLIRGQRGTERFTGTHQIGDYFVLVDSLAERDIGASEIGDTDYYRAISAGLTTTDQTPTSITFAAEAHRPLSPAHVEVIRDELTGDWTITWQRRTRVGGSALDGQDVPLGETSEQYRLRILDDEGNEVSSEDLTEPSYLYDSYAQVQDFGGEQLTLSISVVQLSPALGIEGVPTLASG